MFSTSSIPKIIFTVAILILSILITSGFGRSQLLSEQSEINYRTISLLKNGCVLIYGNLKFGGDDFLIEDCEKNWRIVSVFKFGYIKKMQFTTDSVGWAVVSGSLVKIKKINEFYDLTVVKKSDDEFYLEDLFFLDEKHGWACGKFGLIYATSDGGENWRVQETATDGYLKEIRFANLNFGWARGGEYADRNNFRDEFLLTKDGGKTWLPVKEIAGQDISRINRLFLTSDSSGCAILVDNRTIYKPLTSAWKSSREIRGFEKEYPEGIFFFDLRNGWIYGDSILKTKDGGKNWARQLKSSDENGLSVRSLEFISDKVGWALSPKSVLKTFDGGKRWTNISQKWESDLKKKSIFDSQIIYLSGAGRVIND